MEDRKNLKEYREIYKGKKDEYTLWKRKVSEEIAVTEKSELLNMKKTYEIKLKKEKHMDEKDYLAAYNSNILVILISLLTAFATMFVENISTMGSVFGNLIQNADDQKKFALECIDTISDAFTISIGDVSKMFIFLLILWGVMHFLKRYFDDKRYSKILYYEEVVQLIDSKMDSQERKNDNQVLNKGV